MLSLKLVVGTASEDAYSLLRFIQKKIDEHQELASPKQTALELAIPGQTTTGKESSNPFMAEFKNHLSDNEESLGDDASKQGRIDIGDINTDAEITLIDETQGRINDIIADEDITLIPKLIIKLLK
ncbi:hypothetical protein Tco_0932788, partial [Tanacetum coccineum]